MIITEEEYIKAKKTIYEYHRQNFGLPKRVSSNQESRFNNVTQKTTITESGLSQRARNVICDIFRRKYDNVGYRTGEFGIEKLTDLTRSEIFKTRNCGAKTLQEIDDMCASVGINMK